MARRMPVRHPRHGAGAALAAPVAARVQHRQRGDPGLPGARHRFRPRRSTLATAAAAPTRRPSDAVAYRVPVTPSLDGNTVELSTEQTLFAENAVQYRTTLSFLEGRISTIRRALKGE